MVETISVEKLAVEIAVQLGELEKKLERLDVCFWIHKHEKRGWDKGEVVVKANKWEP